jgi:hypothetical protein
MHNYNTFGAQMSHEQTWIHKTHHGPDLEEATTFPLIVFSMPCHEANTQMSFCPEIGFPVTLEADDFVCRLSIEVR